VSEHACHKRIASQPFGDLRDTALLRYAGAVGGFTPDAGVMSWHGVITREQLDIEPLELAL
jgi:hypothetical protein